MTEPCSFASIYYVGVVFPIAHRGRTSISKMFFGDAQAVTLTLENGVYTLRISSIRFVSKLSHHDLNIHPAKCPKTNSHSFPL